MGFEAEVSSAEMNDRQQSELFQNFARDSYLKVFSLSQLDVYDYYVISRSVNRAIKAESVLRGASSESDLTSRSFPLLPEERRPRTLGLDSDSLAARSSGKFNSTLRHSLSYPSLQTQRTHTHTHTSTET